MQLINKVIHLTFYTVSFFVMTSVLMMHIDILEKVAHTFAWIYIILLYAYLFDEKPPMFLRVEYLYGEGKQEYHQDYVDELIYLSQISLALMRKIQMNESYKVVNESIHELEMKYKELKKLSPPTHYHTSHISILDDVKGFLDGLQDGNYRLIQHADKSLLPQR